MGSFFSLPCYELTAAREILGKVKDLVHKNKSIFVFKCLFFLYQKGYGQFFINLVSDPIFSHQTVMKNHSHQII